MSDLPLYHYTDSTGYNAIRAGPIWRFIAGEPPGDRPVGAYFTPLPPETPKLAKRLGIPRTKLAYVFVFGDEDELRAIDGGRGDWIVYSSMAASLTRSNTQPVTARKAR